MKPFTLLAIVVFTVIALMQLLRVALGWNVVMIGLTVPLWVSLVASLFAALLAVMLWRENRSPRMAS